MFSVDFKELEKLDRKLEAAANAIPEKKKEFIKRVGDIAENELNLAIGSAGTSNAGANLKSWQTRADGSGGGYIKMRAKGSKEDAETGPKGPGAITNYLEGGAKTRAGTGKNKKRKSKARVMRTRAFKFYHTANARFKALVVGESQKFIKEIGEMLVNK